MKRSTRSSWTEQYCANTTAVGVVGQSVGVGLVLIAVRDELVWIDCEMTGLDIRADALIEVAALVTDFDLNVLGEGIDLIIKPPDEALQLDLDDLLQIFVVQPIENDDLIHAVQELGSEMLPQCFHHQR